MIDRSFPAAAWMLAAVVAIFMVMTSGTMAQGPSTTEDGLPVRIPITPVVSPSARTPSPNEANRNTRTPNSAKNSLTLADSSSLGKTPPLGNEKPAGNGTPASAPTAASLSTVGTSVQTTTAPEITTFTSANPSAVASISSTMPNPVTPMSSSVAARGENTPGLGASWDPVMAQAAAATVRIRVLDATGHSWGTGTIVDARNHRALIVTCGHIFRESQGKGEIQVDFFQPTERRLTGTLVTYDLESDIGLLAVELTEPVTIAPIAAASTPIKQGMRLFSVGCNHGEKPSVMQGYLSAQNRYEGPANLTASGVPVEGRSGGGLFDASGHLIGICQAAVPTDNEGLYGAWTTLIEKLDSIQLAAIYQNPQNDSVELAQTPPVGQTALTNNTPLANQPNAAQSPDFAVRSNQPNLWHAADESDVGTAANTGTSDAGPSASQTIPAYLASGVRITDFEENPTDNLYAAHTASNVDNSVPSTGVSPNGTAASSAMLAQNMPQDMPLPNSVVQLTNADSRGISTLSDRRAPDAISRTRNESLLRSATRTSGTNAQAAQATAPINPPTPAPNTSDSPLRTLTQTTESTGSSSITSPEELEVVCIIRPRNQPEGKSEIVRIESPSAELLAEIGRAKTTAR